MGGIIGSVAPSKDEEADPMDAQIKDEWVVIERSGEGIQVTIEPTLALTEPQHSPAITTQHSAAVTTQQCSPAESPAEPTPQCVERHRLKRPCELEFPGSKSVPTLPCIEEESHEYSPLPDSLSPSPHRDQPRSPSVELFPEMSPTQSLESRHTPHRSRTGSLDSKCRDKSRTSSVESTHSRLSEALCLESEAPGGLSESPDSRHRQSLELPSDLEPAKPLSAPHSEAGSGPLFSAVFQPGVSTFQGSLVENILMETKKALRDDGLTAAVRHIQTHLERDSDLHVTKSLLHKACSQSTDLYTFSIALMKIDKTMINYQNERLNGRTPLHVACSYLPVDVTEQTKWLEEQQMKKIAKLLSHNPDCSKQDKDGNTPLHLATFHNNAECVQLILSHSPDCIDMGNALGNTPLHVACRENSVGVVKVLCEHKADARLTNRTKKQRCPLHQAVSKGHSEVVKLLLDYDPGLVECLDNKRMLPLHLAVKRHCPAIALILLKKEHCPVTAVDCEGRTPLHYASELGSTELVNMLLRRDSSREFVNAQDDNGDTALHLACRQGNKTVIKLLKAKNASKKMINKQGETPKEAAVYAGHRHPAKKGVKKIGEFLKRKKDFIPRIPASDPLLSAKSSAQTPPPSLGPGKAD